MNRMAVKRGQPASGYRRFTFDLSDDQIYRLRMEIAQRERLGEKGLSLASLLRELVDAHLRQPAKK